MRRPSMHHRITSALIALPISVAVSLGSASRPGVVKCPVSVGPPTGEPLWRYLVDGTVAEQGIVDVTALDIELIELVCRKEALEMFGVSGRAGVVSIFTSPGPITAMKAALRELAAAQAGYFADHGTYAGVLAELPAVDHVQRMALTLAATAHGWRAAARHDQTSYRCRIVGGSLEASPGEGSAGQPRCQAPPR